MSYKTINVRKNTFDEFNSLKETMVSMYPELNSYHISQSFILSVLIKFFKENVRVK